MQLSISSPRGLFWGGKHLTAFVILESFNFKLSLVEPIETKTLARKVKSYIAKRPINSGLKTVKIEQEVNQTIYSTLYSLKQLKNNLALT